MSIRAVKSISEAIKTMEGAGVELYRAFGFTDPTELDPFLLFDDFRNDNPLSFEKGFPWHPHRGIETITYVLEGNVDHADSLGNSGSLGAGDIQWMTSGSGILHPRYQDVNSGEIPEIFENDGTRVKVIVGSFWGKTGPVDGIAADPQYLDIYVPPGVKKTFPVDTYLKTFAYIFDGSGAFDSASIPTGVLLEKEIRGEELNIRDMSGNRTLVSFDTGDFVTVQAGENGIRFLLISGKPIQEPVAWHGPVVMNTREELIQAFDELKNGTFIKPAH